jgi:hypothetical protein
MFMTAEQKAPELLTIPCTATTSSSSSSPPKYLQDTKLPSSSSPIVFPTITTTTTKESQQESLSSRRPNDFLNNNTTTDNLLNTHQSGGRLIPGAPRTPVSKLTPMMMSRSGSTDSNGGSSSKPMLRARSHSEQRPENHQQRSVPSEQQPLPLKNNNAMTSSPLARRVRSATTLRPSDEDSLPLKTLVASKQQQLYQQQQLQRKNNEEEEGEEEIGVVGGGKESHRRSISAGEATSTKKVCDISVWHFLSIFTLCNYRLFKK